MSSAKQDSVHRLLDIIVEEVSLVDRAANKRRFLIVKRSDPLKEHEHKQNDPADNPVNQPVDTAKEESPESAVVNQDDSSSEEPSEPNSTLEIAVQGLERLTETVETLGTITDGDARMQVDSVATELRALADRLVEAAGVKPAPPSPSPEPDRDLAMVVESVRATLQQVGSLIAANKRDKSEKRMSAPDDAHSTKDELNNFACLTNSVTKLVDALKEQAQRLSKLEKRFGLPNSSPSPEGNNQTDDQEVGWPMDLNRPFGRENVDKAVSFHEL